MAQTALHRATQRVVEVLQQVAIEHPEGLTLTEIALCLKAPKSSLFPIVHTLNQMGLLSYNESTALYSIGFKAFEIGNQYLRRNGITTDILTEMRTIVASCEETCLFAELEGGEVLYLLKVDSAQPIRTVVSPGNHLPAYATGIGKALLSGKTKAELQALYPNGLTALTPQTITDIDRLCFQLDDIKRSGVAFESEESTPHIQCIAVPIRQNGTVRAAMSVAVPTFRMNPQKEANILYMLREAQQKIEQIFSADTGSNFSLGAMGG